MVGQVCIGFCSLCIQWPSGTDQCVVAMDYEMHVGCIVYLKMFDSRPRMSLKVYPLRLTLAYAGFSTLYLTSGSHIPARLVHASVELRLLTYQWWSNEAYYGVPAHQEHFAAMHECLRVSQDILMCLLHVHVLAFNSSSVLLWSNGEACQSQGMAWFQIELTSCELSLAPQLSYRWLTMHEAP